MYYKISANASGFTTYEHLEVKTREEAETALREMVRDLKNDLPKSASEEEIHSFVEEVSLEECISEEETTWMHNVERLYTQLHYDFNTMTIGEYGRLQKAMRSDPRTKWLMLKGINSLSRQFAFLKKACDLQRMPVTVFEEFAKRLYFALSNKEEFDQIATEICRKYGKEQFRRAANEE